MLPLRGIPKTNIAEGGSFFVFKAFLWYNIYKKKVVDICITYSLTKIFSSAQIFNVFKSVGWANDISENDLHLAMMQSSHIVTVWYNGEIIGLIRSMDDNIWNANIDCLIVNPKYQKMGIGKTLINLLLDELKHIHYITVAPNEHKNIEFYKKTWVFFR